jgi:hypothetical protein
MVKPLLVKYLRLSLLAIFFFAANASTHAQVADSANVKHVRLDVARMGLHCPFLGPKLMEKLKAVPTAQNLKLFMMDSYITFELSSTSNVQSSEIKDIAALVGYPKQDITVTIDR